MTDEIWTVGRVLEWIEGYLAKHDDASPRVSARWLVSDVLGVGQVQLYTDLDRPLDDAERALLREYTARRGAGEPLQYITGSCDFRFVRLKTRPGVLIPRPETEVLVSEALEALWLAFPQAARQAADVCGPKMPVNVVDLCTGSGNIACSIASEVAHARVWATDIDRVAVELAQSNAGELGLDAQVTVLQGSLAEPLPQSLRGCVHLLLSNPPYIPSAVMAELASEVSDFEPALALDGGADGLDVFRQLLPQAYELLSPGGVLAVELHETCLDAAAAIAAQAGFADCRIRPDLAGRPRILLANRAIESRACQEGV